DSIYTHLHAVAWSKTSPDTVGLIKLEEQILSRITAVASATRCNSDEIAFSEDQKKVLEQINYLKDKIQRLSGVEIVVDGELLERIKAVSERLKLGELSFIEKLESVAREMGDNIINSEQPLK